jgi:hypothetical protein
MEVYFSTDVEADGPIPGPNSMLSFASAAFVLKGKPGAYTGFELKGSFTRNLECLPGASGHPETMAWWDRNKEAYEATRVDPVPPEQAMRDYLTWIRRLLTEVSLTKSARAVFVAYPATYDFLFVYWYLMRFCGQSPFSHAGLDIKSYAMAILRTEFRETVKRSMPRRWFGQHRHSHVALDDAIEQGELLCNMVLNSQPGNARA